MLPEILQQLVNGLIIGATYGLMTVGPIFDQLVLRKLRDEPVLITILVTIGLSIFLLENGDISHFGAGKQGPAKQLGQNINGHR